MYRLLLIGMENDKFTKIVNALQGGRRRPGQPGGKTR